MLEPESPLSSTKQVSSVLHGKVNGLDVNFGLMQIKVQGSLLVEVKGSAKMIFFNMMFLRQFK